MKLENRIFCCAFVLLVSFPVLIITARSQQSSEIILQMNFGEGVDNLGLAIPPKNNLLHTGSFREPSDIAIDKEGLIYVPDVAKWRILVFDEKNKLKKTIAIPYQPSTHPSAGYVPYGHKIFLAFDLDNRLYIHVTSMNRFVALYRFDEAKSPFHFSLVTEPGGEDIVGTFYVSRHLYIPSFPVEILRPGWNNTIFKYDLSGNFIGMVDYCIEDPSGQVYKPSMEKNGARYDWQLSKFSKPEVATVSTSSLTKLKGLSIPTEITDTHKNAPGFLFSGFDSKMNCYVTNGEIIKVFDASFKLIQEISTKIDDLEKTIGLISSSSNIKISPDGDVYLHGLKTPEGRKKTKYKVDEVRFVVLKFKKDKP